MSPLSFPYARLGHPIVPSMKCSSSRWCLCRALSFGCPSHTGDVPLPNPTPLPRAGFPPEGEIRIKMMEEPLASSSFTSCLLPRAWTGLGFAGLLTRRRISLKRKEFLP